MRGHREKALSSHGEAANEKALLTPRPTLQPREPRGPRAWRARPRPAARSHSGTPHGRTAR